MEDEPPISSSSAQYKAMQPAGVAAEVASGASGRIGDAARLGPWLTECLRTSGAEPQSVALLAGLSLDDLIGLQNGRQSFPLDADHIQRLATALMEVHAVRDPAQVWEAAGYENDDYLISPSQVVETMSGPT